MNNLGRNKLIRHQLRELKGVIANLEEYMDNVRKAHRKANYGNGTYDSINSLTYSAMLKLANMRLTIEKDADRTTHHSVTMADGSSCFFPCPSNSKGTHDYITLSLRKGNKPKCLKLVDLY